MEPIIISASFFQEQLSLGVLGRTGEHEARRISFDCSEVLKTWPEATILCVCRRPCDTAAYPIPLTADGTTYTMPLMSRETAAAGTIKLELRAVRDDTVLKSAIFYGRILPSLNGQKDEPGNPLSDALNRLESTIEDAQTLADEIRQKLDNGEFKGDKGEPGAKGDKGDKGDKGADGSDATVTAENIQSALGYAPVKDVQVRGTSILTNGVANIPKAELGKLGVVACDQPWAGGLYVNPDGIMRIVQAPPTDIDARENATRPITGNNLDYAVKAAMCDGKGAAWTSTEQKAARERIGVSAEFELIEEITLSEDVMNVAREAFPDGTPYNLRSLIIVVDSTNVENRPDIAGAWVRLNAKLPYDEWTYIAFGDFITTNDSFSCFVYRVLSDGSVDSYFARSLNATSTSYSPDKMYIPSNVIRFGIHINDFLLYSINSAIPANTKIAIYGVRA